MVDMCVFTVLRIVVTYRRLDIGKALILYGRICYFFIIFLV